ncbi:phage holin family protein [Saccharopolyspora rosea]|uniref:Phage holin family protein n=1 Tax=Saccharopolyspora rosea TaxID=524884 RepID=A0ABW3FVT9_9PSEU|nr:phage holin family protein [Saccharopolyspora rosea]
MAIRVEPVSDEDLSTRSTVQLVGELGERLGRLASAEIRLAKLELRDKGRQAGVGGALFGAAAVLGFLGGATLVATVVLALALVLPAWLAALIVAVVLLAVAGLAALVGRSRVRRMGSPVPERALRALREDLDDLRQAVRR